MGLCILRTGSQGLSPSGYGICTRFASRNSGYRTVSCMMHVRSFISVLRPPHQIESLDVSVWEYMFNIRPVHNLGPGWRFTVCTCTFTCTIQRVVASCLMIHDVYTSTTNLYEVYLLILFCVDHLSRLFPCFPHLPLQLRLLRQNDSKSKETRHGRR